MSKATYDIKIFGGKRYAFLYYRHSKAEAQREAKAERQWGWSIRVIGRKIGGKAYYDLYGRKRTK